MTEYTWSIESLDYLVSLEGQPNVINNIHWRCVGEKDRYKGQMYGVQPIKFDPTKSFVDYDLLTKETVMEWLKESLGDQVANIEATINKQIQAQVKPTTGSGLPWVE